MKFLSNIFCAKYVLVLSISHGGNCNLAKIIRNSKNVEKRKIFPKTILIPKNRIVLFTRRTGSDFFYKVHFSFIRTILSFNRDQERNGKEMGTKDNCQC